MLGVGSRVLDPIFLSLPGANETSVANLEPPPDRWNARWPFRRSRSGNELEQQPRRPWSRWSIGDQPALEGLLCDLDGNNIDKC